MQKQVFKFLAKVNKTVLPSFYKKGVDLSKANKLQLMVVAWRYYITKNALD